MSSATPCSGWQVVKHWRNDVPRYSMPSRIARYSFGALAIETCATNGEPWPARNVSATVFFSIVLALRGGAEHVHVVAAEHRRRVGVLAAGVRVDLRVEHDRLHVRAVLQDDLRHVLVADVAHAAVAADHPDLRQLEDLLVGHHRVGEVHELVVRRAAVMTSVSRSQQRIGQPLRDHRPAAVVDDEALAEQPADGDAVLEERVHPRIRMRVVRRRRAVDRVAAGVRAPSPSPTCRWRAGRRSAGGSCG